MDSIIAIKQASTPMIDKIQISADEKKKYVNYTGVVAKYSNIIEKKLRRINTYE